MLEKINAMWHFTHYGHMIKEITNSRHFFQNLFQNVLNYDLKKQGLFKCIIQIIRKTSKAPCTQSFHKAIASLISELFIEPQKANKQRLFLSGCGMLSLCYKPKFTSQKISYSHG